MAIFLDKSTEKSIFRYWCLSSRILIVKLRGKPFDIAIIQVYAPTADKSDEAINQFYEQLEEAKRHFNSQGIIFVLEDLI